MILIPLRLNKPIEPGQDIINILIKKIRESNITPEDGDVIAISIKVLSTATASFINLDCKPSPKAIEISKKYSIDPCIAQEIIEKGAIIVGGGKGVVATIYNGYLIGNIGIDRKNAYGGIPTKWPDNIEEIAHQIRDRLVDTLGTKIGVILVDSQVKPLRRGTTGLAVSISGFKGVKKYVGKVDLYGRKIRFTYQNIADDLASAAHIYMGESDELTPFVYIKNPPIEITEEPSVEELKVPPQQCIYISSILKYLKKIDK